MMVMVVAEMDGSGGDGDDDDDNENTITTANLNLVFTCAGTILTVFPTREAFTVNSVGRVLFAPLCNTGNEGMCPHPTPRK